VDTTTHTNDRQSGQAATLTKNKLLWPVCVQCRVLSVSASGYRQHLARGKTILTRRHLSDTVLLVEIRAAYAEARAAYGWPRVWRQLKANGVRACSETLFGSLKVERLHGTEFQNHREAKDATLDWLLWYNGSRIHSTLRYLTQNPKTKPG
jgi:hypothetical protein